MTRILLMNWGIHLLHAAWQASAVAIVVVAFTRAMPRLSSRLRYGFLVLALVKFALPPMLPMRTGIFSALPRVGSGFFWPAERIIVLAPLQILIWLFCVHAIGACVVVVMLLARMMRLRIMIRRADAAPPHVAAFVRRLAARWHFSRAPLVLVSSETAIPFVSGALRPMIVLPATITASAIGDVLAHELGHIRGDDTRLDAFQALLAIAWWWNPVYWLLTAELRRVREERCDDFVLAGGFSSPRDYSLSIVAVAEGMSSHATVAMASSIHALEPRLRRLADNRIVRELHMRPAEIVALMAAGAILAPGLRLF